MALLIYSTIMSLDGYIEDGDRNFDWAEPDEEVHSFINDTFRDIGTHLYGRRLYETMAVWETDPTLAASSDVTRDFAEIWQRADKVVYSRTLADTVTARTRLEREFDADAVRRMKATANGDIVVGGADLASHAFRAGLVDEVQVVLVPTSVGGGKAALPEGVRARLELLDERRFASGMIYLRYRVA